MVGERLVLPVPPSVNRFLSLRRGHVFKTAIAKQWEQDAILLAQSWRARTHWRPVMRRKIVADWWIWWPDHKIHDPNNLEKVLWDALEGIVYDDDQWVLPRCQDFAVDPDHPRVEIAFWVPREETGGEDR